MDKVKSFEFKKGVLLYYKYDDKGNLLVLYMDKWISLKEFADIEHEELIDYKEQKIEIKENKAKELIKE